MTSRSLEAGENVARKLETGVEVSTPLTALMTSIPSPALVCAAPNS